MQRKNPEKFFLPLTHHCPIGMMKAVFRNIMLPMKPQIRFYNTLSRQVERFEPADPDNVKLYVCGPTVYDDAHLGHARCYITWDLLYRFLRFAGYNVHYIRNITDVDDKILARAKENGEDPGVLAERYTRRFHEAMSRLHVESPTDEPKATAYVPQMIRFIRKLVETGYAYSTPSGTVYYETHRKKNYGNLCHQNLEELQSGARVEVDPEKRSPLDFALWKPANPAEPYVWESPWGPGRPGWHIECSAMSYSLLGEQLDIHAGGMDLIFPHHQNEIAQSEAFTEKEPFVRIWMHNGFVNVRGEKMSKSLGNFSTVEKLLEAYDANTIRYFILTHHYRSPVDFSDEALEGARNRVNRINQNLQRLLEEIGFSGEELAAVAREHLQKRIAEPETLSEDGLIEWEKSGFAWLEAMADDLNTPQALAHLNELLSQANPKPGEPVLPLHRLQPTALGAFLVLAETMGFYFETRRRIYPELEALRPDLQALYGDICQRVALDSAQPAIEPTGSLESLMEEIIRLRALARANKDWALSDTIRDRLLRLGIHLSDRKEGPTLWHYEPVQSPTPS